MAFAAMGGRTVCADPPYKIHDIVPQALGCQVTRVPLLNWAHDLEAMAGVAADIAFVCNPHNPSGTAVSHDEIARFAATAKADLIVVDEAYIDFTDDPQGTSAVDLVAQGNVVVTRTFSKLLGLAGLRIGYLVGPRDVIATLQKVRPPFSVNSLAQSAAIAALSDREHRARTRAETLAVRAATAALFENAGYQTVPSQANFVLVRTPDADALTEALAVSGVSVRSGQSLGIADSVRVSIPSLSGLALLERALSRIVPVARTNQASQALGTPTCADLDPWGAAISRTSGGDDQPVSVLREFGDQAGEVGHRAYPKPPDQAGRSAEYPSHGAAHLRRPCRNGVWRQPPDTEVAIVAETGSGGDRDLRPSGQVQQVPGETGPLPAGLVTGDDQRQFRHPQGRHRDRDRVVGITPISVSMMSGELNSGSRPNTAHGNVGSLADPVSRGACGVRHVRVVQPVSWSGLRKGLEAPT
jgi:histidinol-phosphate aminotransferase